MCHGPGVMGAGALPVGDAAWMRMTAGFGRATGDLVNFIRPQVPGRIARDARLATPGRWCSSIR